MTSTTLTQSVTDFAPTLAAPTQTVAAGSSATFLVNIQPQSGFTGPVTLTCSGLPGYATCNATPVSVTGGSATATVTVATTPTALASVDQVHGFFYAAALGSFSLLFLRRSRRQQARLFAVLISMPAGLGLLGTLGCGATAKAPIQGASQTSTFTINVTATRNAVSATHTVAATLVTHS